MIRRTDDSLPQTVSAALYALNVQDLRPLAKVFRESYLPTRKDELVLLIETQLTEQNLPHLWSRLGELEKAAVAESVHSHDGRYQHEKFLAKYGRSADWFTRDQYKRRERASTIGALFCGTDVIPEELRNLLKAFVPKPSAPVLATMQEVPSTFERPWDRYNLQTRARESGVTKIPVRQRDTERDALHDVLAVLRLIDSGKVTVSDKTARPSASSLKALARVLHGGDFYEEGDPSADDEKRGGVMKAFAWPCLVQAARFAKASGTRLELTKKGKSAFSEPPERLVAALWEGWLEDSSFDELLRIEAIKGQTGRGKRGLTDPAERREAIADGLAECPPGQWIHVDDFFRFLRAADHDFEVTSDPWGLYISDAQYGSLGYTGSHEWEILQARYALCFLFEYAATLGLIDVAYIPPGGVRRDFGKLWGTDDLDCLGRYDGLLYFRINTLGAYCLGLLDAYSPPPIDVRPVLRVLPNREIVATQDQPTPADLLTLETYAETVSERSWRLDSVKLLTALEEGHSISELHGFLLARSCGPLPENITRWLQEHGERFGRLRAAGTARLIECSDSNLAKLIANDSRLRKLCMPAGDRHVAVPVESEPAFRRTLRELGYAVPHA